MVAHVASELQHATGTGGQVAGARRRLLIVSLALTAICGALFAAGQQLRSLLGSLQLVHYCLARCKFNVLNEEDLDGIRKQVEEAKNPEPGGLTRDFSLNVLGHAWLVVLPLGVLLCATVLGLVWARRQRSERQPVRAGILFALFAVGSFAAALAAPLVVKLTAAAASEAEKQGEDASFLDAHADFLRWLLIGLPLVAVALGLLAAISLVVGSRPWRSPWVFASFVAVLPLLMGLFRPQIPLFMEEEGLGSLAAAAALVAALVALCFLVSRHAQGSADAGRAPAAQPPTPGSEPAPGTVAATPRPAARWSPSLAVVVAVIVWSTLFLAWERGLNLGNQAAQGDQIFPKRFGLLSVRSSVVCLIPTQQGGRSSRTPFVYLGQVGSTLVLYDYLRDIRLDIPKSFPVRRPAGDVDLRLAEFEQGVGWSCPARDRTL